MKEYLNDLYKEYQMVKLMTEEQVLCEYDDSKSNVLKSYENSIDSYENCKKKDYTMRYDIDEAFNSWESVNSMFI